MATEPSTARSVFCYLDIASDHSRLTGANHLMVWLSVFDGKEQMIPCRIKTPMLTATVCSAVLWW